MGTGSHRPQWEAAKGREDARTGIKHARSLPSHTRLKFRRASPPRAAPQTPAIEAPPLRSEHSRRDRNSTTQSRDIAGSSLNAEKNASSSANAPADGHAASEDDDDSEAELRRELDLINKRKALLAQRETQRAPAPAKVSKWRSEATFKRTKPVKKRGSDLINDPLQKAEHQEFLDKYLK